MEALLFMIDGLVMVALVLMGLRDDRKPPGARPTSLFRTRDDDVPVDALAPRGPAWDRPPA